MSQLPVDTKDFTKKDLCGMEDRARLRFIFVYKTIGIATKNYMKGTDLSSIGVIKHGVCWEMGGGLHW